MTKKQQMRVSLSNDHRAMLEAKAREFGCNYTKGRGLSQLLEKIGDEEIKLVDADIYSEGEKQVTSKKRVSAKPLIKLIIEEVNDSNGTIYVFSEKIAEMGGNIFDIYAHENSNDIQIIFEAKDETNQLFKNLEAITFSDIKQYNTTDKIKGLLGKIAKEAGRSSKELIQNFEYKQARELLFNQYDNSPIIKQLRLLFCFQIKAENKPRVLASIAQKVASRQITIRSIKQASHYHDEVTFVKLVVVTYPLNFNNVFKEMEKLKNDINQIETVRNINQINVEWGQK